MKSDVDKTAARQAADGDVAIKHDTEPGNERNSHVPCESASNSSASRCQYPQYPALSLLKPTLVLRRYSPIVRRLDKAVQAGAPYMSLCDKETNKYEAEHFPLKCRDSSRASSTQPASELSTVEEGKSPSGDEEEEWKKCPALALKCPAKMEAGVRKEKCQAYFRGMAAQQNLPPGSHMANHRNAGGPKNLVKSNGRKLSDNANPAKTSEEKCGAERSTSRPSSFGPPKKLVFTCRCDRSSKKLTQNVNRPVKCRFLLKERDDIDRMLHDPDDRRIRRICERFGCDLKVHDKRYLAGFVQYKVEIAAKDMKSLTLCARNLDLAFGWNMSQLRTVSAKYLFTPMSTHC